MKKIAYILLVFLILSFPLKATAQSNFPIITIPPKDIQRNQLQLFNESSDSAQNQAKLNLDNLNKKLLNRLNAGYNRLNRIANKISSRLKKSVENQPEKNRLKIVTLSTGYNNIVTQLSLLKKDLLNTEEQLQLLSNSIDPKKEYPTSREAILSSFNKIAEILENENSLLAGIKEITPVSTKSASLNYIGN